jgi:hypothetical protein
LQPFVANKAKRMILANETPWPAIIQHADLGTAIRYAVVILKATYQRQPDGGLVPADEPIPITGDPVETAYGMLNGDIFLRKDGADLCVLGTLKRSHKVKEATVSITCGDFTHSLRIYGDRAWIPTGQGDTLIPSSIVPFDEMELTYRRAYGGIAVLNELQAPCPDNPIGRGYYLSREEAMGKLLPNIEAASARPIRTWQEHPDPAGWAPYFMSWGLRARRSVAFDPKTGTLTNVAPSVFNNAHPELVLRRILPGTPVTITGVRDTPWTFEVPKMRGRVAVTMGPESFEVMTRIDGVFAWMDADRVVVTHRGNFKYVVQPGQIRGATLTVNET